MRRAVAAELAALNTRAPFVFLTGDLGFNTFESLREAMGARFINAGVAEQNMVGVAAGLARTGHNVWVYSIAPFLYARALEQIRNDICLHGLNVRLLGNGGGYGYGVMAGTHHAIDDYGLLLTLQNMHAYVPAFQADIAPLVARLADVTGPAYLRLGTCEKPTEATLPPYASWRKLLTGEEGVLIAVGPLAGSLWTALAKQPEAERPSLWVVSELPFVWADLPGELRARLSAGARVVVVEEHVRQGGAGQMLATALLERGVRPQRFKVLCAAGYPSGRYGSQEFHRAENGLSPQAVLQAWKEAA